MHHAVQRRPPIQIAHIHVRAALQQEPDHARRRHVGGNVEHRVPARVARVDAGAVLDEHLRGLHVPVADCDVQGVAPADGAVVDVGAEGDEERGDGEGDARGDGVV